MQYSFRSLRHHPTLMLRAGRPPPFAAFIQHALRIFTSALLQCSFSFLPLITSCMLHFGKQLHPFHSHRIATRRLPTPLLPCVFRLLRHLPTFMLQAGQAPAFSAQTPHRSVSVHSANQVNVSLMLRFNNHLVCCIHSRSPFCVHLSLSLSLCSLMLRSSTHSFAQFTQHSCSMANASFRSSGKTMR